MDGDFSTALTTALAGVGADFAANLAVIIPVTFGIAAVVLLYRKAKGLIR